MSLCHISYLMVFWKKSFQGHHEIMTNFPCAADSPLGCHIGNQCHFRMEWQRTTTRGRQRIDFYLSIYLHTHTCVDRWWWCLRYWLLIQDIRVYFRVGWHGHKSPWILRITDKRQIEVTFQFFVFSSTDFGLKCLKSVFKLISLYCKLKPIFPRKTM